MAQVELVIPGRPVPKGRPRRGANNWYTPTSTIAYESTVAMACRAARVRLRGNDVKVTIELPRGLRGDLDNYAKSILDGLQLGQLVDNDRQVVELHVRLLPVGVSNETRVTVEWETLDLN